MRKKVKNRGNAEKYLPILKNMVYNVVAKSIEMHQDTGQHAGPP